MTCACRRRANRTWARCPLHQDAELRQQRELAGRLSNTVRYWRPRAPLAAQEHLDALAAIADDWQALAGIQPPSEAEIEAIRAEGETQLEAMEIEEVKALVKAKAETWQTVRASLNIPKSGKGAMVGWSQEAILELVNRTKGFDLYQSEADSGPHGGGLDPDEMREMQADRSKRRW